MSGMGENSHFYMKGLNIARQRKKMYWEYGIIKFYKYQNCKHFEIITIKQKN